MIVVIIVEHEDLEDGVEEEIVVVGDYYH